MIFATDLDKTIIYYKKYVNDEIMSKVQLIETIDNRPISYISKKAKSNLEKISKIINIIPTTTRSIDQFFNIKTFEFCKYAIVSNGGTILYNREKLPEWENYINTILNDYREDFEQIIKLLEKSDIITSTPIILDNIYVFSRVEDKEKSLEFLNGIVDEKKWNYCIQGKKLYIIPKQITKANAVKFLKDKLNDDCLIVAGDSLMDQDMLDIADIPMVPKHGELYQKYNYNRDNIIYAREGIFAADDIVQNIIGYIEKERNNHEIFI